MDLYTDMLMNAQTSIMSATKSLISDLRCHQDNLAAMKAGVPAEELFSEEHCREACAVAGTCFSQLHKGF